MAAPDRCGYAWSGLGRPVVDFPHDGGEQRDDDPAGDGVGRPGDRDGDQHPGDGQQDHEQNHGAGGGGRRGPARGRVGEGRVIVRPFNQQRWGAGRLGVAPLSPPSSGP